jgi:hypothetical protein
VETAPAPPKDLVIIAAQPASRLWIALMIGLGSAALAVALVLVLGELLLGWRGSLFEAVLNARSGG